MAQPSHRNIRRNILEMVNTFPKLKDNRNEMITSYWLLYDSISDLESANKATPAESITRNFRFLVNSGAVKLSQRQSSANADKQLEYHTEFSVLRG